VGEIGIQRETALYIIPWWEIICIVRGYERRHRHTWSAARWMAFCIMSAQAGTKAMQEAHIYKPSDLLPLPWDSTADGDVTQEDVEDMQATMDAINQMNEDG
jgi:hypothetical protein